MNTKNVDWIWLIDVIKQTTMIVRPARESRPLLVYIHIQNQPPYYLDILK